MIDDIRYLIVFAKIAETGSVSGGAEALGLSAATASLHLSRLERNLGRALLYRNSRKLSLTQDGTQLLDTARSMLELYEKGFIEFRQRAVSTRNSLRISMPAVLVRVDYTPRVRVDSVEASCRLARLGVGLAAPPTYLSDEPIRRGELRAVLPEWRLEPLKVYAVWPPNVPASSIAYTLINRLYEAFNPG